MTHRRVGLVVLALLVSVVWLAKLEAAVPRLLMLHGAPLARPIVVDDWPAMFQIFDSTVAEPNEPQGRPYLELVLFWGTAWVNYVEEGRPLDRLRPEDVTPFGNIPIRGKFYPACGDKPAVMSVTPVLPATESGAWRVSDDGLKVLQRFGAPVRLDCK